MLRGRHQRQQQLPSLAGHTCLLAFLIVICWATIGHPQQASAHAQLEASVPGSGAELSEAPGEIQLTFTQDLVPGKSYIHLVSPSGSVNGGLEAEQVSVDGQTMRLSLNGLPDGVYEVQWRAKSVDTHITEGSYRFAVGVPLLNDAKPSAAGTTGSSAPPSSSPLAPPAGNAKDGSSAAPSTIAPSVAGMASPSASGSSGAGSKPVSSVIAAIGASGEAAGRDKPAGNKPVAEASPGTGGAAASQSGKPAAGVEGETATPGGLGATSGGRDAAPDGFGAVPNGLAAPDGSGATTGVPGVAPHGAVPDGLNAAPQEDASAHDPTSAHAQAPNPDASPGLEREASQLALDEAQAKSGQALPIIYVVIAASAVIALVGLFISRRKRPAQGEGNTKPH